MHFAVCFNQYLLKLFLALSAFGMLGLQLLVGTHKLLSLLIVISVKCGITAMLPNK